MGKQIKRSLFVLILFIAVMQAPLAQAEGGLVFQPYWTFETKAPVTHVRTGDIDGDGLTDIIILTADSIVHVLENDGNLAWRYEIGSQASHILVADPGNDDRTAELYVGTDTQTMRLSPAGKPIWEINYPDNFATYSLVAADLNGDGQDEVLRGNFYQYVIIDSDVGLIWDVHPELGLPLIAIWVGDVDGDGQPEIVPSPDGGNKVSVYETYGQKVWQQIIDGTVGLVRAGDVDGDGQAEVVVLTGSQDLILLESDGSPLWQDNTLSRQDSPVEVVPEQLLIYDLDGDGRQEIVTMAPGLEAEGGSATVVHAFDGAGRRLWQHPLDIDFTNPKLVIDDVNGDGAAEAVATTIGAKGVYLLNAEGDRLAEYLIPESATALAYEDLNGDGRGEVIVGTTAGVQVFGTSDQVVRKELWRSSRLEVRQLIALELADLDGDGQTEVLASTGDSRIHLLAVNDGSGLDQLDLTTPIVSLSAGDVDDDGNQEVVTVDLYGVISLIDDKQTVWSVGTGGGAATKVAVHDLDGDGLAEIIVGTGTPEGSVLLLDGQGDQLWRKDFGERVKAVGHDGEYVLAGMASGIVYRLATDGTLAGEYDLGAHALSLGEGQAATADGRIYRLDGETPHVVREMDGAPKKMQYLAESIVFLNDEQVSLISADGSIWPMTVDGQAVSFVASDLNLDGEVEVAIGTADGRVHLFGLFLDQPPILTDPSLVETRTGYSYSVNVNDPEADAVPIALEIWDPSAATWRPQPPQTLPSGLAQGRLTWDVSEPFDSWDSGQESRFRFSYDFDDQPHLALETAGPLTIPTTPWYVFYGQRIGLAILVLLIPIFGFVFYYRQRAYRRSPVGRADTSLKRLRTHPQEAFLSLHDLARDQPTQLSYLPSLAREAGQPNIADLSEGFHLILTRPDVAAEGLQAILTAVEVLAEPPDQRSADLIRLYQLFRQALEANTVPRIVTFRPHLTDGDPGADALPEFASSVADLSRVTETLNNSQRVETVADKTAYLAQAFESLDHLQRQFPASLPQPEANILGRIAAAWTRAVTTALQDLQGRAQIEVALKTRQLLNLEQATLPLELTNTGRSPASNITVTLVPDRAFAVGNGTAQIDILPAGRSTVVEMDISAASSVDQFRAEFNISFDDRESSGKSLAFADRVHLLKPDTEFQPMPNPYAPGTPLAPGSPIFFGRDDLFQFISENISGLARQNILVLIGQRRMGKTSFLQQLPARLGQAYLPVYVDGQSLGIDPGMANFFYDLALAMVDALADQNIRIQEPLPEDFEARPSATFERVFLPGVMEGIGQRQLLLLFDEFEELEMRVASGKLEPTIFPFFRHLMQHHHQLGFIFVGTHRLEALSTDYWSIFFNIALYKHVTFLDEAAARSLIVEPVAGSKLVYDDLALEKMQRVTAGHPYFLQLTCHALVNRANRERRNYMTIQDVNEVLEAMVELGEAHFAFLWEQSSWPEQLVLAALSQLLGREPAVTTVQVVALLNERGLDLALAEVTGTLRRLVARDILRETAGQPPRYEYKIELVRLWVDRYKALGRVIEEN